MRQWGAAVVRVASGLLYNKMRARYRMSLKHDFVSSSLNA